MDVLIKYLKSFNRKERFFLIGAALGNENFELSPEFRTKLGGALDLVIPPDAFVAMDYHLDWIFASMFLASGEDDTEPYHSRKEEISGTQQDTDLLVAYRDGDMRHLILVEAKGVGSWNNKQLNEKAERLRVIFGDEGNLRSGVVPHFVLTSPNPPTKVDPSQWPYWMHPKAVLPWFKSFDLPEGLLRVQRVSQSGTPDEHRGYWGIRPGK